MANNFGHTPLHLAAHRGDAETTSFLVFEGAFVHAMDRVSFSIVSPRHVSVRCYLVRLVGHPYTWLLKTIRRK